VKKSWVDHVLPRDEHKQQTILYFLAESSIILVVLCFSFLFVEHYFSLDNILHGKLLASVILGFIIIYTYLRYILSGVEYTNIFSNQEYKEERKNTVLQSLKYSCLFSLVYLIFGDFPGNREAWLDVIGLSIFVGFFMFLLNFISLNRSYKKNKELEEDDLFHL